MQLSVNPKKILHVIPNLNIGGAEGQLVKVCVNDMDVIHTIVILGSGISENSRKICFDANVNLYSLNITGILSLIFGMFKLVKIINKENPIIVQTWMYHADLYVGILVKILLPNIKIYWNVRSGAPNRKFLGFRTYATIKVSALVSCIVPDYIVYNSYNGAKQHEKLGYARRKRKVIPNGVDFPSPPLLVDRRMKLAAGDSERDTFCIGHMSRNHPIKNLDSLLRLVARFKKIFNVKLLLGGADYCENNQELRLILKRYGIEESVELLGKIINLEDFYSKIDIFILNSYSEGFPNVLLEAMSHSIPCVSSDVIDKRILSNGAGWLVEVGNDDLLFNLVVKIREEWGSLKKWELRKSMAYEHVYKNYQIKSSVKNYHNVWFPAEYV